MGAFMSALWAEETRFAQFTQRARKFTDSLNSIWNKVKDFTYPAVSIFSGLFSVPISLAYIPVFSASVCVVVSGSHLFLVCFANLIN